MEYPGDSSKVRYTEGFDIGYRYYDKHPEQICYPFGFGKSYTTFVCSDFRVERKGAQLELSCCVINTGTADGSEVVQIYVGKKNSMVTRAVKDLKAFEKVFLTAGETKSLTLTLDIRELAYYNVMLSEWVVEPGEYDVMFATSARDILHSQRLVIDDPAPYSMAVTGTTMIG